MMDDNVMININTTFTSGIISLYLRYYTNVRRKGRLEYDNKLESIYEFLIVVKKMFGAQRVNILLYER